MRMSKHLSMRLLHSSGSATATSLSSSSCSGSGGFYRHGNAPPREASRPPLSLAASPAWPCSGPAIPVPLTSVSRQSLGWCGVRRAGAREAAAGVLRRRGAEEARKVGRKRAGPPPMCRLRA
ncbi:hypothetical protein ZWY2020_055174 [Hordeum vulgare]|nr:hypothetical protein ZWY2020_055174 [Hordeum vulgare]